ncbi:MAG: preprotein translocase subunit YajC [Oligosphaeraceae bacterium]
MNTLLSQTLFLAQEAAATPAAKPAGGSPWGSFIIFIPIFGLMYFLMIRPQQKKQKQIQEMLQQLKAGDKVMMNSGALGTVVSVAEKTVRVSFADGHQVDFVRAAVAEILAEFPGAPEKKQ